MSIFNAVILGLIQGVTEFLPVSSSGHLSIAQNLLGIQSVGEEHLLFDMLLHLGTLFAVLVFYRQDVADMIREFFFGIRDLVTGRTPNPVPAARRLVLLVVLGTLPLVLIVPIKDLVEGLYYNTVFIGFALLVTGFLLFFSDRVKKGRKTEKNATVEDALVVGLCQALATLPGISRSGMTITAGCFRGFDRKFAVRYSFLLSLPAILGANILDVGEALAEGGDPGLLPIYAVGVVVAAVSGYLCLKLLRYVAEKGRFGGFAYYCWFAGALTLILTMVL